MRKKRKKEKYYVCDTCGELSTESEQIEAASSGGLPYCYCQYELLNIFNGYSSISFKRYTQLSKLSKVKRREQIKWEDTKRSYQRMKRLKHRKVLVLKSKRRRK